MTTTSLGSSLSPPRRPQFIPLVRSAARQHRYLLIGLAVGYAAVTARLLATGIPLHAVYAQYLQHHCVTQRHPACGQLLSRMNGSWVLSYAGVGLIPTLVGMFAGAPLSSRDSETGSYRFSQVQGVSARRQTSLKLLVIGAAVVAGAALTGGLVMWCLAPFQRISLLPDTGISHWWPDYFNATAVTLPAWALLGFCLGGLAGALIKRTAPAMAMTAACTLILAVASTGYGQLGTGLSVLGYRVIPLPTRTITTDLLVLAPRARPALPQIWPEANYNPATHTGHPARPGERGPITEVVIYPSALPGPHDSFEVSGWFTWAGRRLTPAAAQVMLNMIPRQVAVRHALVRHWLAARQIRYWIGYQPANRYWLFQSIAAAMLVAAALLAGLGALWRAGRPR